MKLAVAGLFVALSQAQNLGHIEFPTSGKGEAQEHFVKGVLLLHSFEYADAREEFQAASKLDGHFAMAYWGEALTHTHPVWVQQDAASARAVLARLGPTPAARQAFAPTEREKDYLQSVEILYGDGDKSARDDAYAEAMGRLAKKYPSDLEAASLYAVALLGTCQYERQAAVYMRAAAVAEEVFAKNPEHPGAIHYLIHSYDDPVHAPLGLRAARVYGKVAGAASHAQHMPSHIFFALGMWREAIAANELSVAVADERVQRKGLSASERNYHSLTWLLYGYLQEGRRQDAERLLSGITFPEPLKTMRAIYAIETGKWDRSPGDLDLNRGEMLTNVGVLNAQGLLAASDGRTDEARKCLQDAKRRMASTAADGAAHGSMAMGTPPNTRKLAQIMVEQLEGAILFADGRTAEAFEILARTAQEEDGLTFEFGPPVPLEPAHELYGKLLLEAGRRKEAREEFKRALERAPGRRLSLQGLAAAGARHPEGGTKF